MVSYCYSGATGRSPPLLGARDPGGSLGFPWFSFGLLGFHWFSLVFRVCGSLPVVLLTVA